MTTFILNTVTTTANTVYLDASVSSYLSTSRGSWTSTFGEAVLGSGSNHVVTIYGYAEGARSAIALGDSVSQDANEAVVVGSSGQVVGYFDGIHIDARNSNVRNDGLVYGVESGIEINANIGTSRVVNTGTIMGDAEGIRSTGAQTLIIENSGTIFGGTRGIATFGGATALITNTGTIIGEVYLDSGNDVYNGLNGRVSGPISCFGGNDTVYAGIDDDVIDGMGGNDILNGGLGADRMIGGSGNDAFYVDNVGDVVIELNEIGVDRVISSVNFSLGIQYIENLTLSGTAAINGAGNGLSNVIVGNAAANILSGGLGNDTLTGGAGNDSFLFNTALNATTNVDIITDFNVPQDTIRLENAIFTGLGAATGVLNASMFVKNTSGIATSASHHIIYDADDGLLYYDSNGSAAGGSTLFAHVSPNLLLTNADFLVI